MHIQTHRNDITANIAAHISINLDAENFCRNPDNWMEGPWCFTTDVDLVAEECDLSDIPTCGKYQYQVGSLIPADCSLIQE